MSAARISLAVLAALALAQGLLCQGLAIEARPLLGMPVMSIGNILETSDSRLWLGGVSGLWCHDGLALWPVDVPDEAIGRVRCLGEAPDGSLLCGLDEGLYQIPLGSRRMELVAGTERVIVKQIVSGDDACYWVHAQARVRGKGFAVSPESSLLRMVEGHVARRCAWPDSESMQGFALGGNQLWAWTDEVLWTAVVTPGVLQWRELASVPIRDAAIDGDGLVLVGSEGVAKIAKNGEVRWLHRGGGGRRLLITAAGYWITRSVGQGVVLHLLPHDGGLMRPVHRYSQGVPPPPGQIVAMAMDRQGLLWLGSMLGVSRACLCKGVDNCIIGLMEERERAKAIEQAPDGRLWLGTSLGRLLVSQADRGEVWRAVDVPWEHTAAISCIVCAADGRIWVATQLEGLWLRSEGAWRRVGEELGIKNVRTILERAGLLWGCSAKRVWTVDADGAMTVVPVQEWQGHRVSPAPADLAVQRDGSLWLGCYGRGTFRYDPSEGEFRPAGAATGAMRLAVSPATDDLFVRSLSTLIHIRDHRVTSVRLPDQGSRFFRGLRFTGSGGLWEARATELFQHRDGVSRTLSAQRGSHPLGYSFRAENRLDDGDVVFGTTRGYTRIADRTSLRFGGRARLLHCQVVGTGVEPTMLSKGRVPRVNAASFRLAPVVIDRGRDLPVACSVWISPRTGEGQKRTSDGVFDDVADGIYDVQVNYRDATGSVVGLSVGALEVVAPSCSMPWGLPLALGGLLVAITLLLFSRRRRERSWRADQMHSVVQALGKNADEVLDLAFVVIASADGCDRIPETKHISVWLRRPQFTAPTMLTSLGPACPDALARMGAIDTTARDRVAVREVADGYDVVITLSQSEDLVFQVLLTDVSDIGDRVLDDLDLAFRPARLSLSRYFWMTQLQAYYVESGLSLEADVHDLRNPLTALRLGIHDLHCECGKLNPAIQNLAEATETLISAVDRIQSSPSRQLGMHKLPEVVEGVVDLFRSAAGRRGIRLCLSIEDSIPMVAFDEGWFRRALENIVGNAIKYTFEHTRVRVVVRLEGDQVVVQVDDEGPGIEPELWDYVFMPGFTGKSMPRDGSDKTGIGLWVSRQALRAMGGRMWIQPGATSGTSVCMSLPLRPLDGASV